VKATDLLRQQHQTAHQILGGTLKDCPEDVLNWRGEASTIDTIAHIYVHTYTSEDAVLHGMLQGKPTLYETEGWAEKTGVALPESSGDDAHFPGMGDVEIDKLKPYAQAVIEAADAYLAGLSEEDLDRVIETGFMGEMPLAAVFSTFIIWHIDNHNGEIAALKGVQGHKGLAF
jgi:hypothetical protein